MQIAITALTTVSGAALSVRHDLLLGCGKKIGFNRLRLARRLLPAALAPTILEYVLPAALEVDPAEQATDDVFRQLQFEHLILSQELIN